MNICHGKHQSKRCGFAFCGFAFRHALVTLCLLQTLISAQLAGAQVRGESLEIRSTSLQQTAASLTGFQAPLQSTPFSLSLIDTQTASDFGLHALSDLLRSDPAVSDAYNTIGYPENFAIRGFLIDPRLNYRRDGLPINGHVPL
ncbi:MAG: Plug domain-containing protein, partial [Betaproteobacteria bacterium]|nr:Plug domain-containing protein [Betaproteobacteria bacterium]